MPFEDVLLLDRFGSNREDACRFSTKVRGIVRKLRGEIELQFHFMKWVVN